MAYPGTKSRQLHQLRSLSLPITPTTRIIDPFYGGGGLTYRLLNDYPLANRELTIAAESFAPLRSLLETPIDLPDTTKRALRAIELLGTATAWDYFRECLRGNGRHFTMNEAFVVLNNLGFGNSMRHSDSGQHNIKLATEKLSGLQRRGCLIDPVTYRPACIYDRWQDALNLGVCADSVVLLDPPYLAKTGKPLGKIYPNEDAIACGLPPIARAMELGAAAVVAFNHFNLGLDCGIVQAARKLEYVVRESGATGWRSSFDATAAAGDCGEAGVNGVGTLEGEYRWVLHRRW
jgi:site-specific DNA-adenine methylase